jgi:glutamate N-acetyltransferase/amino-acid N-acetyltransferase
MKVLNKIVLPAGFKAAGIHCGIKKSRENDLGLIYSDLPCVSGGMFTSNKTQAASLKVCKEHLKNNHSRAIIVNSGNANCFTGKRGVVDSISIIKTLAKQLGIIERSVLIASTGIIGKFLPVDKIKQGIPNLCKELSAKNAKDFARAIMTTDTFEKSVSLKFWIKDKQVTITGFSKGAGMICPHLEKQATMLAFVLTDAAISKPLLNSALSSAVGNSFNSITIDGCMSTNDTVLVLANGAASNSPIKNKDKHFELFSNALSYVCLQLSEKIIEDAEGLTKVIDILVKGAKNIEEAKSAADSIANSNLFKTAMFGGNPNWGRIVAAIGAAGIVLNQERLDISFNRHKIFSDGKIIPIKNRDFLVKSKAIKVEVDLKRGKFSKNILTSDLTPKYVHINAEYN